MGIYIDATEIKHRYDEMLREAAQERFARQFTAGQPGLPGRLLRSLGETLITMGQSLKTLSISL
jgi:hypothetical protein